MRWRLFPKKTARHFILTQLFFIFVMSLFFVLSVRHYIGSKFTGDPYFLSLSRELDTFVLKLGWLILIVGFLYTIWVSVIYFYPLGRLLAKSKHIKRGSYKKDWDQQFGASRDIGEWYELELTLNKIHRELGKYKQESHRRQTEIESLAGAVSDGILAIDPMKRVQFFNGQMALILGKEFDPLLPPSFLDEVFRAPKLTVAVDEVIELGQSRRTQIQMRPHKSKENHIFDVVVTPVKNEKKQNHGVIAVFHDVTETKKVEEVRIDFVANASHELKTPITSIKGFSEALEQDLKSHKIPEAQEKLIVIHRNIERLDKLVRDLLDLSRLDSSGEASKEEISTEIMTEDLVRELRPLFDQKKQKIEIVISSPIVKANRVMLSQTLSNLLENANKYSDLSSMIKIEWFSHDESICLRVSDTGPGISEEHLSRLFERFYRVQNGKVKSGVAGTGLGLSIVKNCMLKQRGHVDVDSVPGRGTVFTCYFPKNV